MMSICRVFNTLYGDQRRFMESGKMLELVRYASYAGYKATLGYVKTGKESDPENPSKPWRYSIPLKRVITCMLQNARTTYVML